MINLMLSTLLLVGASSVAVAQESVILIHGLARTHRSMTPMKKQLTQAGYRVYVLSYPTTEKTIQQLAEEHLAPLVRQCKADHPEKIHFVTHSMGGLVLRQYFANHQPSRLGRIVMLGPPNRGSEVVDKLGHLAVFNWINGPAGSQMGTGLESLPGQLPPPPGEVGIIAGTRSMNWVLSCLIPGPDDGKVAIENTKANGMSAFITLPATHPFLMRNRKVMNQTLLFLQTGRFQVPVPQTKNPGPNRRHRLLLIKK